MMQGCGRRSRGVAADVASIVSPLWSNVMSRSSSILHSRCAFLSILLFTRGGAAVLASVLACVYVHVVFCSLLRSVASMECSSFDRRRQE